MVKDIEPGSTGSEPQNLFVFNGKVYFRASTSTFGPELWTSDGTAAGTAMVKDINPGTGGSGPQWFVLFQGMLYFRAFSAGTGSELWVTDGTEDGTTMVADILPGSSGSNPRYLTVFQDKIYFSALGSGTGTELWVSDGTQEGTTLVKDILSGTNNSTPRGFTVFNGKLYFSAFTFSFGWELWVTDGTEGGTTMVKDLQPGSGSSLCAFKPDPFTVLSDELYFRVCTSNSEMALARTDGTEAGTQIIKVFDTSDDTLLESPTEYNQNLCFRGYSPSLGFEPWCTDGTEDGTALVKDIYLGSDSSSPDPYTAFNGLIYFAATTATCGLELWKSDGTAAGTVSAGQGAMNPAHLTVLGDKLLVFEFDNTDASSEGCEVETAPPTESTAEPTLEPTAMPVPDTVEPTSMPTVEPTSMPTVGPTSMPTAMPTGQPTGAPVEEPGCRDGPIRDLAVYPFDFSPFSSFENLVNVLDVAVPDSYGAVVTVDEEPSYLRFGAAEESSSETSFIEFEVQFLVDFEAAFASFEFYANVFSTLGGTTAFDYNLYWSIDGFENPVATATGPSVVGPSDTFDTEMYVQMSLCSDQLEFSQQESVVFRLDPVFAEGAATNGAASQRRGTIDEVVILMNSFAPVIARYDFEGSSYASADTGVTNAIVSDIGVAPAYGWIIQENVDSSGTTTSQALQFGARREREIEESYIEFGFELFAAEIDSLDSITFDAKVFSSIIGGPTAFNYNLYWSIDGFGSAIASAVGPSTGPESQSDYTPIVMDLSDLSLPSDEPLVTFRLDPVFADGAATNGEYTQRRGSIDNLKLKGHIIPQEVRIAQYDFENNSFASLNTGVPNVVVFDVQPGTFGGITADLDDSSNSEFAWDARNEQQNEDSYVEFGFNAADARVVPTHISFDSKVTSGLGGTTAFNYNLYWSLDSFQEPIASRDGPSVGAGPASSSSSIGMNLDWEDLDLDWDDTNLDRATGATSITFRLDPVFAEGSGTNGVGSQRRGSIDNLYLGGEVTIFSVSPIETTMPTDMPTSSPTAMPATNSPTAMPANSPTTAPSAGPTDNPTGRPTESPSAGPTDAPTVSPSAMPTVSPTVTPSAMPTDSPTAAPTQTPIAPVPIVEYLETVLQGVTEQLTPAQIAAFEIALQALINDGSMVSLSL